MAQTNNNLGKRSSVFTASNPPIFSTKFLKFLDLSLNIIFRKRIRNEIILRWRKYSTLQTHFLAFLWYWLLQLAILISLSRSGSTYLVESLVLEWVVTSLMDFTFEVAPTIIRIEFWICKYLVWIHVFTPPSHLLVIRQIHRGVGECIDQHEDRDHSERKLLAWALAPPSIIPASSLPNERYALFSAVILSAHAYP